MGAGASAAKARDEDKAMMAQVALKIFGECFMRVLHR